MMPQPTFLSNVFVSRPPFCMRGLGIEGDRWERDRLRPDSSDFSVLRNGVASLTKLHIQSLQTQSMNSLGKPLALDSMTHRENKWDD